MPHPDPAAGHAVYHIAARASKLQACLGVCRDAINMTMIEDNAATHVKLALDTSVVGPRGMAMRERVVRSLELAYTHFQTVYVERATSGSTDTAHATCIASEPTHLYLYLGVLALSVPLPSRFALARGVLCASQRLWLAVAQPLFYFAVSRSASSPLVTGRDLVGSGFVYSAYPAPLFCSSMFEWRLHGVRHRHRLVFPCVVVSLFRRCSAVCCYIYDLAVCRIVASFTCSPPRAHLRLVVWPNHLSSQHRLTVV